MSKAISAPATAALLVLVCAASAAAQTEFHFQYGYLNHPFRGYDDAQEAVPTRLLTFQQASPWAGGDSFYFIDLIHSNSPLPDGGDGPDAAAPFEIYGEWYPTLSLGKVAGRDVGAGALADVAAIGGINFGSLPGGGAFLKYLPGVRLSWSVPGFYFVNTDFTAFLDGSEPHFLRSGPGWMFDVSWGAPVSIGSEAFWFTGHAEYISATPEGRGVDRAMTMGDASAPWILAQPQFGWDAGRAFGGDAGKLFLGVEYQYWWNKLGTGLDGGPEAVHDNAVQLWVNWRL